MENRKPALNVALLNYIDLCSAFRSLNFIGINRHDTIYEQGLDLLPYEINTSTAGASINQKNNVIQSLATTLRPYTDVDSGTKYYLFGPKTIELWQKAELGQHNIASQLFHLFSYNKQSNSILSLDGNKQIVKHEDILWTGINQSKPQNSSKVCIKITDFSTKKSTINVQQSTDWSARINKKEKPMTSTAKISCSFCRANNEATDVYTSHTLYANESRVLQCPILRKLVCPICGGTGDSAHTVSYCPLRQSNEGQKPRSMFCHINKSHRLASGKLRI